MCAMASPWAKLQPVEAVNLQDIMSEEVARDLQAKEEKRFAETLQEYQLATMDDDLATLPPDEVCESDAVIAMMLQKQFDKEYDVLLKRNENKVNGTSKVSVSFCNYRRSEDVPSDDADDEEPVDVMDRKDWDRFDPVLRSASLVPRCGYMRQDGNLVTKHDMTLAGRKNACKFMSFPPEFQTGDGAGFDLQLSNRVFNSLKAHSSREQSRRHRVHDRKEDHATAELGVDASTRLILYKLVNNHLLERVNGVVSTGKEAVILHADCATEDASTCECAVKVFKTTLSEFKQRDKYIRDDHRFRERYGKQSWRKAVQLWAEKEMHNLVRMRKAGVPCPEVVALKKHVLVMSFVGRDHRAAPKLKDVQLQAVDWIVAYEQVVAAMRTLFTEANLVHADLSEYNILWHEGRCWFIDVGQSVEPTHPDAYQFLYRDCTNICTFFRRRGVPEVMEPRELFVQTAGFDYGDRLEMAARTARQKPKPHLVDRVAEDAPTQFEHEWENAQEAGRLQLVDAPVA